MAVYYIVAYALGFWAATGLVTRLARGWRQAAAAHWTERARLGFGPGYAVLLLAGLLPVVVGAVGAIGVEIFEPRLKASSLNFLVPSVLVLAGVMTVRYRWLRELWGSRVTLRTWSAGCLVVLLALMPHLVVWAVLLFTLPQTPNARSALMLAGGVLAVLFFALGGGIRVLRIMGVMRLAGPELTRMVNQLAEQMKLRGPVKVFEIEWAQVNAVAWVRYWAVGLSRSLLEVMSPDETRAVAAHELGHLLEPEWVRWVRTLHMFAYLATLPVIKFGGGTGLLAGYGMIVVILLAYQRFSRRMEARADCLENEAIAHTETYMRSMVKLHEANLAPAVMPGTQTHPDLYDRLLAAGIQPDFAKPLAPSRSKPLLAALVTAVISAGLMFATVILAGVAARFGL